jgi:hypothetical protein
MKKINKVVLLIVIVILIGIGILVKFYGPKVKDAVFTKTQILKGSEIGVVREDKKLVQGFPVSLVLIKDAEIISSKKVVNGYALSTYSTLFSSPDDLASITKTYKDFFSSKKLNIADFKISATDASFNVGSPTSSYKYTARAVPGNKRTEFTLEVLVKD